MQEEFLELCKSIPIEALLWPESFPQHFSDDYLVSKGKKSVPYPLADHEDRIKALQWLFDDWSGEGAGNPEHPLVLCYYLNEYQKQFRIARRKSESALERATKAVLTEKKSRKPSAADLRRQEREREKERHYRKLQALKNKLPIEKSLKTADSSVLQKEVLAALRELIRDRDGLFAEQGVASVQAVADIPEEEAEVHSRLESVLDESQQLRAQLEREKIRADLLEEEVQRLAEQIISSPTTIVTRADSGELDRLKKEFDALSHQYDALVSKNIDLSNRLNRFDQAVRLEEVLDSIRDRFNSIFRSGVLKEEVLLSRIGNEVEQLQRARVYLGRALFDMGKLYLRMGKRDAAFQELRAARELGVEDPEAERFLQSAGA
jgi:predicted nuclease with TOPRIM domain